MAESVAEKQELELPVTKKDAEEEKEFENCPIEEVRLTVPVTDDPTAPALTFRTWFLGLIACFSLSFINTFFGYRNNALGIGAFSVQIAVLPIGKLMAATLPTKPVRIPVLGWSFSLNPGPFNVKEHVLITIFANCGGGSIYAIHIVTIVKTFYRRNLHLIAGFLLVQTTQMLGYGWAGIFRKYLVDSPYMWWPSNLVQVSLFRALHDADVRPKGGQTRLQFFLIALACGFAYYIVPNYFFPSISALSIVCWIWKRSVTAQQIGSGYSGLGIGSFGLDWSTIAGFTGSPLATPASAIFNIMGGFFLIIYVLLPITYWTNAYDAKKFPIFTSSVFDIDGNAYNTTRVIEPKSFSLDLDAYNNYSKIYLSVFFSFSYGLSFATLTATISHVALFHGKDIFKLWKLTTAMAKDQFGDAHTKIMKKNYKSVPQWWFQVILVLMVALAIFTCEGFGKQLQLPYWGILLACAVAFSFTLPIGIINATTNQQPGLNVITELIIGYMYPGKPLANVSFKTYGYISMTNALWFLQDFKLGVYMKIPPRSMFWVQLVGTFLSSAVTFGTAWWLLESLDHICVTELLPEGSPWTCPGDRVFYNASIIWGLIGPLRMFGRLGVYPEMNYFFLIGLLAPVLVWALSKAFPKKKWIEQINMPIILGSTGGMPPTRSVHMISYGIVGVFFQYYVYTRYKAWWARHTYILSAALDAGTAFMGLLVFYTLQTYGIYGMEWWGLAADDHCPLASCPTAPGVVADGCPAFS